MTTYIDVTHLVDTLDASDEPWTLWRAAGGKWIVHRGEVHDDPASRTLEADTICGVLQSAVDSKRLPVIPRKPRLQHISFEQSGTGGRTWKVTCDGCPILHLRKKIEAQTHAKQFHDAQIKARDAWVDEHFHFTETHIENIDFYWTDR